MGNEGKEIASIAYFCYSVKGYGKKANAIMLYSIK